MLRDIRDPNIWRVYGATLALGLAFGVALSVVAIYLDERGFTKGDIGLISACFACGIVALAIPAGALIRRFGAKAVLTVSVFGYGLSVAAFPLMGGLLGLILVRVVDGACSVSIWVSSETLLLARSGAKNKGLTMSLYALAMAIGYIVGPLIARATVGFMPLHAAFYLAGGVSILTGFFVLLTLDKDAPVADEASSDDPAGTLTAWAVLWKIKASCFATFSYGYFQSSVVPFLPLFLMESKGIEKEQTILIPAFFAVGMVSSISAVGWLGDRFGHLLLMRTQSLIGMVMVLGFAFLDSFYVMCVAVLIAGASLAAISPVSLALQGQVIPRSELSRATAIYNAFYASGILLGPLISGPIFERIGGEYMILHLAALWLVFIVFSIVFRRDDPMARRGH